MPSLVIIGDLDIECIAIFPAEADPPLIVDPDTVLAFSVPRQLFEPIPGRDSQIRQGVGRVKHQELPQRRALNALRELSRTFAAKDPFGLWVLEAPNHLYIITHSVNNVKRYVLRIPQLLAFCAARHLSC